MKKIASIGTRSFGHFVRARRRQLDLTQEELARRTNMSSAYIAYLEAGKRHASAKFIAKVAGVLGLDVHELFFLANPGIKSMFSRHPGSKSASAWEAFSNDQQLRKTHRITDQEMQTLSQVARMGEVRCSRDFIFILNSIRHALGR
jgi:transcriptional regulator with XRE-family HTH domain